MTADDPRARLLRLFGDLLPLTLIVGLSWSLSTTTSQVMHHIYRRDAETMKAKLEAEADMRVLLEMLHDADVIDAAKYYQRRGKLEHVITKADRDGIVVRTRTKP